MRRRKVRKKNGAPKWMVTYSDMITLILVFFILLFSISQVDLVKFEAISESFQNRMIFDFLPSAVPLDNPTDMEDGKDTDYEFELDLPEDPIDTDDIAEEDSLRKLTEDIEAFLDENELNNVISASRTERGVVLVLQESILFNSGEAIVLDTGKPFLNKVGTLLSQMPNQVKVEGHTDDRPIATLRYPSNWELSGARASGVIRYLIQEHNFGEFRFSAVGYADTRPVVPNINKANWSKNRRVEIVILEGTDIDDVDEVVK